MADWKERLGGSNSASQAAMIIGASSVQVAASNGYRRMLTVYNGGPQYVYYGYGATAVASQNPLPPGGILEEQDYLGAVNFICSSGTSSLHYVDVGGRT